MTEDFAGFTADEWVAALTRAMGEEGARAHVRALFARLRLTPSNGFSLDDDTFALLSLVNASCAERVASIVGMYPPTVRKRIEARIRLWRSAQSTEPSAT
jgi:hypothetical protein